jgi:hypothetical protein
MIMKSEKWKFTMAWVVKTTRGVTVQKWGSLLWAPPRTEEVEIRVELLVGGSCCRVASFGGGGGARRGQRWSVGEEVGVGARRPTGGVGAAECAWLLTRAHGWRRHVWRELAEEAHRELWLHVVAAGAFWADREGVEDKSCSPKAWGRDANSLCYEYLVRFWVNGS